MPSFQAVLDAERDIRGQTLSTVRVTVYYYKRIVSVSPYGTLRRCELKGRSRDDH